MDTESEVVDESKENKTISDGEITSEDDMEEGEISDTDTSESDVATEPEDETNVEGEFRLIDVHELQLGTC